MAEIKQIEQTLKGDKKNVERRAYYQKNKKKMLAYFTEKIECECGVGVARTAVSRHRKSKKHAQFMFEIEWFDDSLLLENETVVEAVHRLHNQEEEEEEVEVEVVPIKTEEEKQEEKRIARKAYYEKNKKKYIDKACTVVECECGDDSTKGTIARHRKSKKHAKRMETIKKMGFDEEEEEEEEIVWTRIDCACCYKSIKRDSREHDECLIIDDVLYCGDCC